MYIVGLTGGVGSGKTAVSDYLQTTGITVVDADQISREVVEPGTEALLQIEKHFGEQILHKDGTLNRPKLRAVIFSNSDEKTWLEKLLHPLIGAETFRQLETATSPYALFVTPLLAESNQQEMCDEIIVVDASERTQIERTMKRDNNSEEIVKAIINSQIDRKGRLKIADHVLANNDSLAELQAKTQTLHEQLLTNANKL